MFSLTEARGNERLETRRLLSRLSQSHFAQGLFGSHHPWARRNPLYLRRDFQIGGGEPHGAEYPWWRLGVCIEVSFVVLQRPPTDCPPSAIALARFHNAAVTPI